MSLCYKRAKTHYSAFGYHERNLNKNVFREKLI